MPVKILLADKSITIQKVVEMLFSGKEYEVTCVSDGETALSEASRIGPSVVLADMDLPRVDGYTFSARLREIPSLAQVPVILMLSRDDQYDAGRGRQVGIVDNIAKPFESQELISKVKKALVARPVAAQQATASAPAPPPKPVAPPPTTPAATPPPPAPEAALPPKKAVPSDIFGIIEEAPSMAAPPPQPIAAPADAEMEVEQEFEVEPEIEVDAAPRPAPSPQTEEEVEIEAEIEPVETEQLFGKEPAAEPGAMFETPGRAAAPPPKTFDFSEPLPSDAESALPLGARAMEEMREGLGLGEQAADETSASTVGHPDFVSFESLDMASRVSHADYAPPRPPETAAPRRSQPAPMEQGPSAQVQPPVVSEEMLAAVCREAVEQIAREVLERVAWEVIPDLAERLIREEIERLKSGS